MNISIDDLTRITTGFKDLNIIVLGDIFIDKLIFGKIQTILREFAVPELNQTENKYICGAASNCAVNCAKLGCKNVFMVGVIGNDYDGKWILNELQERYNINADYIISDDHFHTMSYTKIYNFTNEASKNPDPQCIMAINRNNKNNSNVNKELIEAQVIKNIIEIIEVQEKANNKIDGIIIQDQIASLITPNILQNLNKMKTLHPNIFIMADSRSQIGLFNQNNIKLDLIKANNEEMTNFTGISIQFDDEKELTDTMNQNINKLCDNTTKYIVITCGRHGVMLYNKQTKSTTYLNHKQCKCIVDDRNSPISKDETGCGDCVTSLICLLLSKKQILSDYQCVYLCNIMGTLSVQIFGTSQISIDQFFAHFIKTQYFNNNKIIKEDEFNVIKIYIDLLRRLNAKLKIVYVNGYFDLFHSAHASLLEEAKTLGDILIVGVNIDYKSNYKQYSNIRPINDIHERIRMLSYVEYVDIILPFSESDCRKHLKCLKPDIHAKGGDYNPETINQKERQIVDNYGGEIKFINGKYTYHILLHSRHSYIF